MRSGREAEIAISTVPKVLAFIFAVRGATTNLLANICLYRCGGYNSLKKKRYNIFSILFYDMES